MTRLAEIEGHLASMSELQDVVGAMRSLAGMRVQEAQHGLAGIGRYADELAAGIGAALWLVPTGAAETIDVGPRALVLFATEHGFVGGFNERLVEAAEAALEPRDLLFVLGSRGAALLAERGRAIAWTRPMATRLAAAPDTVRRLTDELYRRIARGEFTRLETIFGRYVGTKGEGLRYNFPYPIGGVVKPDVGSQNSIQIGFRAGPNGQGRTRDVPDESLMLTGDENIVDLDFEVQWRVNPLKASDFVFNLQNPEGTIKAISESAMREVIGRRNIQAILTNEQSSIAQEVKEMVQKALDEYGAGVRIEVVQLVSVNPPPEVRPAFIDVNAAQQDADTAQNEAKTYASREVP